MSHNVGVLKIAQCTAVVSSVLYPNGQGVVLQLGLGLGLGPGNGIISGWDFHLFFSCVKV